MKRIFFTIYLLIFIGCQDLPDRKSCQEDNRLYVPSLDESETTFQTCYYTKDENFNLIIDSQKVLDKHFSCQEDFEIDFDNYFILAGRYTYKSCFSIISEELFICNNTLIYQVNLNELVCDAVTTENYFKVIERKYYKRKIHFDVNFNN